jgi:hypothetical protein
MVDESFGFPQFHSIAIQLGPPEAGARDWRTATSNSGWLKSSSRLCLSLSLILSGAEELREFRQATSVE